jgi:hypothetical protein
MAKSSSVPPNVSSKRSIFKLANKLCRIPIPTFIDTEHPVTCLHRFPSRLIPWAGYRAPSKQPVIGCYRLHGRSFFVIEVLDHLVWIEWILNRSSQVLTCLGCGCRKDEDLSHGNDGFLDIDTVLILSRVTRSVGENLSDAKAADKKPLTRSHPTYRSTAS